MPQNTLYNFIETVSLETVGQELENCLEIVKDQNKSENNYYRIELKLSDIPTFCDQQMQLISHHISVYDQENKFNPSLSQYHYTAYFSDGTHIYQLHVYYNNLDICTQKIRFSIKDMPNSEVAISEEFNRQLINLADTYTKPIITLLREQLKLKLASLEEEFMQLDKNCKLLSRNLNGNYESYIELLEKMKGTRQLINSLQHVNQSSRIKMIDLLINWAKNESQKTSQPLPPTTVVTNVQVTPQNPGFFTKKQKKQKKKQVEFNHVEFNKELQKFVDAFSHLTRQKLGMRANYLKDVNAKLHFILTLAEGLNSIKKLTALEKYQKDLQLIIKEEITYCLQHNKFDELKKLPEIENHIPQDLSGALENNNVILLKFILEFNPQLKDGFVIVNESFYPSPLIYCMQEKNVECMVALIETGVSLMDDDENELPVAYTILSTENHPLVPALDQTSNKTIGSITFYENLISKLGCYLAKDKGTEEEQKLIRKDIEKFTDQVQNFKSNQFIYSMNRSEKNSHPHSEITTYLQLARAEAAVKKFTAFLDGTKKRLDVVKPKNNSETKTTFSPF